MALLEEAWVDEEGHFCAERTTVGGPQEGARSARL